MFGYITVCREGLTEKDYNTFRAYYCGLCAATGRRCSQLSRMGLSYDITFLAVILSSMDAAEPTMLKKRCIVRPTRRAARLDGDRALYYAADMGVILSYLKLLDDWRDEKNIRALLGMAMFYSGMRRARKRRGDVYDEIRMRLDELRTLEKENCSEIDRTADCFAKVLAVLFTPDFITDRGQRRALEWLGYNIGRWIYIIDAYNDIEKDYKKGSYNTFLSAGADADTAKKSARGGLPESLTFTLENASSAYELLNIHRNKAILENIIYMSLKNKQDYILGENNESV